MNGRIAVSCMRSSGRDRTARPGFAHLSHLVSCITMVIAFVSSPAIAGIQRHATVTWRTVDSQGTVEFAVTAAFENVWGVQVGDYFAESLGDTGFDFGDGQSAHSGDWHAIQLIDNDSIVLARLDPGRDGDDLIYHTYQDAGPFQASMLSCCRFDLPDHINNPDGAFQALTVVTPAFSDSEHNASPITALPITLIFIQERENTFYIPAVDPDNDTLTYRLATDVEASGEVGGFAQPGLPHAPNALTVDPTTGLITWDTTGATLNQFQERQTHYSCQIIIEDGHTQTPVDLTILLARPDIFFYPEFGYPPTPEHESILPVVEGATVRFVVQARDRNYGDTVTLDVIGLPDGAVFESEPANPVFGRVIWTPTADDIGIHRMVLTASDGVSLDTTAVSIEVQPFIPLPFYTITDLGTLGGLQSAASAINDIGTTAGMSTDAEATQHAVIWDSLDATILEQPEWAVSSNASGLNILGSVCGTAVDHRDYSEGFVWSDSTLSLLKPPLAQYVSSAAGLNNWNEVVGTVTSFDGNVQRAFMWADGTWTHLRPAPGHTRSSAAANNDAGFVVGRSWNAGSGTGFAYLWDSLAGTGKSLGRLSGLSARALAINNVGEVAGASLVSGNVNEHAFLWTRKNGMTDLGTLGGEQSVANGINDRTMIVGSSDTAPGPDERWHATLWADGRIYDLNDFIAPGDCWTLQAATDINNTGIIAGIALLPDEQTHAVMLTPVSLMLDALRPSLADDNNVLSFTGAAANSIVYVIQGKDCGSTPVRGCPGLTVDMTSIGTLGGVLASPDGYGSYTFTAASWYRGATYLYQLYEPATCRVSNVIRTTFY
ncbi:MAG: hypothetical protein D8M59_09810 [Planctomycetes bacterium]|nr:hypothetical protein [Planctomycetota bacterium]NOG53446.1 hypothetical protein [Planctomycetota bacterium]